MERKPEDNDKEVPSRYNEPWRDRVAADLVGYQAEQRKLWGGIDELTLARYEAGTLPDAERARVEQAMRDHPALRECMETARELSADPVDDTRQGRGGEKPWADRPDRPETGPGKRR
jgi:anti-sigma factor RsiW